MYESELAKNTYPGRGIVAGVTPDGDKLVQVYWIMGRSANSRNRIFVYDGEVVRTEAKDPAKLVDPALVIYDAACVYGRSHIVTNGDQTDTIYDALVMGDTFEEALLTRCYEPDGPNFTPRISCLSDGRNFSVKMAILKTLDGDEEAEELRFFRFFDIKEGDGYCIHTYAGDDDPLPSFDSKPRRVKVLDTAKENAERFWGLLNEDNRVAVFAKTVDKNGVVDIHIING